MIEEKRFFFSQSFPLRLKKRKDRKENRIEKILMIKEEQSDKNRKNSKNICFLNFFLLLFPSNEKGLTSILLRLLFYTI